MPETDQIENPAAPFSIHFCGRYEGQGRGKGLNERTRLLHASKYNQNLEARAEIVKEMAAVAVDNNLYFRVITWVPHRDSGTAHARALALGVAAVLDVDIVAPSRLRQVPLQGTPLLVIDDVYQTGASMRKFSAQLIPQTPLKVTGLVYLKTFSTPGVAIMQ